jgi:multidrug efflux system outer membrane protein
MHLPSLSCGLILATLLAGCALQESRPKSPEAPAAFAAPVVSDATWPGTAWYAEFGSSELQALIAQAEAENLDLTMARARVRQADARARQAGAAILPSVDVGGNGNYLAGHSSNGSAHETDWAALLSASYEVDFWGKNRATARSAQLLASASRADRDTIALTALAGVANAYFQVLSLRERLAIASSNLESAKKLLEIIQARFDAGLSNPVELSIQKSTLAAAALVIPELQQQEAEGLAALAIILGRAPQQFSVTAQSLNGVLEPKVAPGLPSELLTRRPDIYLAEANMRAANADLTAARAALLPNISLTAAGGVQNPALNAAVTTLSGVGPTLSLGASLSQVIFDGGRLRAARAEAQAKEDELVAAYRSAILAALVDVENALSAVGHLDDARAMQDESLAQSERAFEGATLRFKAGAGDFLTALEAQHTLYGAREQYAQYRLTRLQALVALCKSLGGGWQVQDATRESR